MKIKTKLIISFFIILFVPLLLAMVTMYGFNNIQIKAFNKEYGLSETGASYLTSSLRAINRGTWENCEELAEKIKEDTDCMEDPSYLEELDTELREKWSYLVVTIDGAVTYNGGENNDDVIKALPAYGTGYDLSEGSAYLEMDEEVLVRKVEFLTSDGGKGCAYVVTTTQSTLPAVRSMLWQLAAAIIIILILTAILLIFWLYSSLITPLHKLQEAAENIKEGNLDFELDTSGNDEISELAVTFEQMRARLKDNAEEKLSNEKENRALISNIVHDLKTPITAVKGYAEGILDGVANTPEKQEKYIRTIYNKANEMNTLINELTLYSKIDTNRIPYNFAKINVSEYFSDCIAEIGLDLEAKGIGLAYYNYAAEDTVIIADPEQLRRVINNIIGNSVKYMGKEHGFINIRVKDVGDFIQVEMEDNGKGIAQKDLPYIFDRFYRADASRNSAIGGSGIGLSIVKKIIEDHGGKIWATSKEDTGTCMYFVIRKYQEVK